MRRFPRAISRVPESRVSQQRRVVQGPRFALAQDRNDSEARRASEEFVEGEGLDHVIIGASVGAVNAIVDSIAGGGGRGSGRRCRIAAQHPRWLQAI